MKKYRSEFLKCSKWLLIIYMVLAFVPSTVLAEDTSSEFIRGVIPDLIELEYPTPEMVISAARDPNSINPSSDLPAAFDSRDYGFQSSVKNQGANGICWTFGTLAAAEANMRKNGYYEQDFSEIHMAYSTSDHSGNSVQGWSRNPGSGGNRNKSSNYLMRGTELAGMVNESDDPYTDIKTSLPDRDLSITQGKTKSYVVRNIGFINEGKKPTEKIEIQAIKAAVMNYGGVDACMYWEGNATAESGNDNTDYYNAQTASYYYDGAAVYYNRRLDVTHEIEIAGWDDAYSRENFNAAKRPEADGAWLVKNSWGTDWGDNGYFWISYEDTNFPLDVTYIDGVQSYDENTTVYESDYKTSGIQAETFSAQSCKFARVYTTDREGEQLHSVKVFLTAGTADIEIDVIPDFHDFSDYVFVSKGKISVTYPGWYTIDFDKSVEIKGSQFAVVVRITSTAEGGTGSIISYDNVNTVKDGMSAYVCNPSNGNWVCTNRNYSIKAVTTTMSDEDAVAAAKSFVTWDMIKNQNHTQDAVRTDLMLPPFSEYGTEIIWSSNSDAIHNTGTVMRGDSNEDVTLTAKIKRGNAYDTVSFDLKVIGIPTADIENVENAKNSLTWDVIKNKNESQNAVTSNLVLPTELNGTSITWSSSQSGIPKDNEYDEAHGSIDTDGTVTRPPFDIGDISIRLTAVLTFGEASETKSFDITLLAYKGTIQIDEQSSNILTLALNDTENLQISASKKEGEPGTISYQWYQDTDTEAGGGVLIDGATTPDFPLSTHTEGIYYYYCEVFAPDAAPILSDVFTVTVTSPAILQGMSLTLEGQIGVNFYMIIPEIIQNNAYVKFDFSGRSGDEKVIQVANAKSKDNLYKFTYPVVAKEMHDIITLRFYDANGNILPMTNYSGTPISEMKYSVADYLKDAEQLEDDALKNLVHAMDVYGNYAQKFFTYDIESATNTTDISSVTAETVKSYMLEESGVIPDGLTFAGMTLLLESETSIRLYFITEDIEKYQFQYNGEFLNPVYVSGKETNKKYYVALSNIAAKNLDETKAVLINDHFTISCSAMSYAAAVLKAYEAAGEETDLCNLVRALYLYNDAANQYFN